MGRGRASAAITGAAAAPASGELRLGLGDDNEAQRRALLALPARAPGPPTTWMRITGDPDVFLAQRRGGAKRRRSARPASRCAAPALTAWAERASSWRSYLTAHLWRAVAPC